MSDFPGSHVCVTAAEGEFGEPGGETGHGWLVRGERGSSDKVHRVNE